MMPVFHHCRHIGLHSRHLVKTCQRNTSCSSFVCIRYIELWIQNHHTIVFAVYLSILLVPEHSSLWRRSSCNQFCIFHLQNYIHIYFVLSCYSIELQNWESPVTITFSAHNWKLTTFLMFCCTAQKFRNIHLALWNRNYFCLL